MLDKIKNNILEICSIFIAVCALFIAIYQADSTSHHNRLSVVPILEFNYSFTEPSGDKIFSVINRGLGPAVVKMIECVRETKVAPVTDFKVAFYEEAKRKQLSFSALKIEAVTIGGPLVIRAGDKVILFRVIALGNNDKEIKKAAVLIEDMKLGVCYRSIYGDRFYLRNYLGSPPNGSCNYSGSIRVFGSHFRLKKPWQWSLSHEDILGD